MIFNSLTFVVFFAVVLALYSLPLPWRVRKSILLVGSYVFYGSWNPPFLLLLWLTTVMDWAIGRGMHRLSAPRARHALLVVSVVVNLALLGWFKYADFLLASTVELLGRLGIAYAPAPLGIVLPIGISFYTFQSLSYTIEVYRRRIPHPAGLLDFAFFVSFFPHLVAGPILRAADILPQCESERRATAPQLGWGFALLLIGLVGKVILADGALAPLADRVYTRAGEAGMVDAWGGTLAFAGQIFFDFAGYSTCAIGCALCLGFAIRDNFRFPYAAVGLSDFWRRWHISLSSFLRDYLYVPLGGNRHGPVRTRINLMLTMLLGGLWHGAAWRFVVWGGLHGAYLIGEREARERWGAAAVWRRPEARVGLALLTFGLVCLTWVFFRATTFGDAAVLVTAMLGRGWDRNMLLTTPELARVLGLTIALLAGHWYLRDTSIEAVWQRLPRLCRPVLLALLFWSLCLVSGDDRAFIYFQF